MSPMIRVLALLTLMLSMANAWSQHLTGTGENFGSGWRADGQGGYIGTGEILVEVGVVTAREATSVWETTSDGVPIPTTGAVLSAAVGAPTPKAG